MAQSSYYKRLKRECHKISPHIRFKRIRCGFVRIYYKNSYLHEVDESMPRQGYDFEIANPKLEDRNFYQEYEDQIDVIKTVKNFKEGYNDAKDRIQTRIWMHRHNLEFNQRSEVAYRTMVVR